MTFNLQEKKLFLKINEFNSTEDKEDKIVLISIGKSNLLKENSIRKKYFKLVYEKKRILEIKLDYLDMNLL